ncbi:MAG: hypothetical protein EOP55_06940 [Sphingobacteriales bacterium]|nr:MAG: hypothetical protein EOP55_06940 [Sphingobacteriales bacterium]
MKKLLTFGFCLVVIVLASCNAKPDSSVVKKEVLNIHDKLMMDGEKVVKNRMKLDSILKSDKIRADEDSVEVADLISRLNKADENMMDWMHFFKDDFKGKTEQEDLDYYKSEMVKIRAVEDGYIKVTRESDSVLKVYNVMPPKKMQMEHRKH